jgi:hypothetical protein
MKSSEKNHDIVAMTMSMNIPNRIDLNFCVTVGSLPVRKEDIQIHPKKTKKSDLLDIYAVII